VHVFPNSVDADLFCPAPQEVDPNRVLFVGKLNRLKGIFVLADAIRTVFARLPSATLTVIGSDHVERGESCQERFLNCFSASERSRVRMLGPLSHGDVAFEVRRCNVLVLPSFTEMCPVVVLEAMSCGRPVVASNRAGIPEIVQDGRTGLLANPDCPATFADALTRLLSDRSLADAMGTAGREAVLQKYTSDSVVDRLQHFYAEISDRTAQR
jgi:glycosyltransferase involved in cell wall biosynthesis